MDTEEPPLLTEKVLIDPRRPRTALRSIAAAVARINRLAEEPATLLWHRRRAIVKSRVWWPSGTVEFVFAPPVRISLMRDARTASQRREVAVKRWLTAGGILTALLLYMLYDGVSIWHLAGVALVFVGFWLWALPRHLIGRGTPPPGLSLFLITAGDQRLELAIDTPRVDAVSAAMVATGLKVDALPARPLERLFDRRRTHNDLRGRAEVPVGCEVEGRERDRADRPAPDDSIRELPDGRFSVLGRTFRSRADAEALLRHRANLIRDRVRLDNQEGS